MVRRRGQRVTLPVSWIFHSATSSPPDPHAISHRQDSEYREARLWHRRLGQQPHGRGHGHDVHRLEFGAGHEPGGGRHLDGPAAPARRLDRSGHGLHFGSLAPPVGTAASFHFRRRSGFGGDLRRALANAGRPQRGFLFLVFSDRSQPFLPRLHGLRHASHRARLRNDPRLQRAHALDGRVELHRAVRLGGGAVVLRFHGERPLFPGCRDRRPLAGRVCGGLCRARRRRAGHLLP